MHSHTPLRPRRLLPLVVAACLLFAPHAPRAQEQTATQETSKPAPQDASRPAPQETAKPSSQEGDEEVVRISSELVQTDVMVFDKQGKFVDGLKPEQFELRVDGRARQIVFFDRVVAGAVNEDAQLAAARGEGGGARRGPSVPLDRGRSVIFFVDDLHLVAGGSMRVGKTLRRYIDEEIGQNDEACVVSASGQVGFLQQFTDNKAVLRAAAARIGPRSAGVGDMQRPPMTEVQAFAIERYDPSVTDYFVDAQLRDTPGITRQMAESLVHERSSMIVQQSGGITVRTLSSLYSTLRNAEALPGRKLLFFISDGFVLDDRGNTATRDWMRRVTDEAARAGVVIYTLDAEGLRTGQPDASSVTAFDPGARLASVNMSELSEMQSPLYSLAADTGGRALLNTNAMLRAVSGALKETSLYYLLAWKPDAAGAEHGSPKYQNVEVAVKGRPDLHVVVRRAYYNAPPPEVAAADKRKKKNEAEAAEKQNEKSPAEQDLLAALRAPVPRGALPTSMALNFISAPDGGAALTASVEVDASALTFEQTDKRRATFDVLGVVLDDNGKTVRGFKQQLNVTGDASGPDARQTDAGHVVFSYQLRLPPGLYQVRVAARDTRGGRTGSAMQWVEIPEFRPGQLMLSSLFIGERRAADTADTVKAEELSKGVLLSVGRRFARTSWIRFMTYIYNAAPGPSARPDVALQIQVFRDDQPVFTAPLKAVSTDGLADASRIPYAAEMALASFPAGRYVLQVTAIDRAAKTSATQRTGFIVE